MGWNGGYYGEQCLPMFLTLWQTIFTGILTTCTPPTEEFLWAPKKRDKKSLTPFLYIPLFFAHHFHVSQHSITAKRGFKGRKMLLFSGIFLSSVWIRLQDLSDRWMLILKREVLICLLSRILTQLFISFARGWNIVDPNYFINRGGLQAIFLESN